uniref:Uncharacterized protein n=2 Tax=Kalanchoe fedtschenkoi TaxID=63787 RepID=A0A7N0RDX6_KALFE
DSGSSLVRTNESEKGGVEEVILDEEVEVVKVDSDEAGVEITRVVEEVETVNVLGSRDFGFEVGKTGGGSSRSSSSSSSSDDEKIDAEVTEVVVPVSIDVEQVYEMVESVVDPPVPGLAVEEVVVVSEASPVEDPYEDLDVLPGTKATTEAVLPVLTSASESLGESSNVDSSVVKDAEVKVFPPSDSPVDVTRNGAGHLKDQEIQDPVENQTSRPQVPLSVQRTSWKGCCGLFEVFSGSRFF